MEPSKKKNRRSRLRTIATNLVLFAVLFGLVFLNKRLLRPMLGSVPLMDILTGSFPNFIAAFFISLAVVNAVVTARPRYGRHLVYAGSLLVFAILALEEVRPMWGASTYYDSFDILASGLGSLLSISVFESIMLRRRQRGST
jgi:hypothetical protein